MAQITLTPEQLKRAQSLVPLGTYSEHTIFGKRVLHQQSDKQKTAVYVTDTFLDDGRECFLGDGSSAMYVMLAILERNFDMTVWTVNAAVVSEFLARASEPLRVKVKIPEGPILGDYAAIVSNETENPAVKFAQEAARYCNVSILPTTAVFFHEGICANGGGPRRIKEIVATHARRLVILTDWEKLSKDRAAMQDAVFSVPEWKAIKEKETTFLVTTKHPSCMGADHRRLPPNPTTELERYLAQWWVFSRPGFEPRLAEIQ